MNLLSTSSPKRSAALSATTRCSTTESVHQRRQHFRDEAFTRHVPDRKLAGEIPNAPAKPVCFARFAHGAGPEGALLQRQHAVDAKLADLQRRLMLAGPP